MFYIFLFISYFVLCMFQENANPTVAKKALGVDNYEHVHNLVQYYQLVSGNYILKLSYALSRY